MTVSPLKIFAAFIVWLLLTSIAVGVYAWQWLSTKQHIANQPTVYVVAKGSSLHAIARDLHQQGIIQWPKFWVAYARVFDLTSVKAGEYRFEVEESPRSILQKVNDGAVIHYQLTLVEGSRFSDFLTALHAQQKLKVTLTQANALANLQAKGVNIEHPEGWFYPDTYRYVAGDTDISILLRAYEKMTYTLAKEWLERAENLPYETPYEALIMASIVEKETGVAHERAEIAGVFVRRLQRGMRLQTDPTVIYGMGDAYDGNIRRKDLRTPTSYNTYTIKGLPPTPIAMPGTAAIRAALHPADGDTLYFVAKGDGTHYFSATIEEHNRAVVKYQKRRRENYRSSPASSDATSSGEEK